jgi:hypothetical protein
MMTKDLHIHSDFVGVDAKSLDVCRGEITQLVADYPTLTSFLETNKS